MSKSRLSVRTAVGDALALGFRRPVSVTVWGLVSILCLVGTLGILGWALSGLDVGHSDAPFSPEVIGEMIKIQGASHLFNLATLGFTAILLAAVTRAGLGRRHGRSLAFMQIGMDEFRVLVIQFALGIGLYLLLMPLIFIGLGIGVAVWPLEPAIRYAAISATALALVVFFIWIALRVVLITPMTVAVRRFSFIEGWRITRGRVWRLLGIAILSWLACLLVSILFVLAIAVAVHVAGFAGMVDLHALEDIDWSDHGWAMDWDLEIDWRTAGIVAAVAALPVGWLSGMTLALSYAPWASAYRQIAADPEPDPAPEPVSAPPPEPQPEPEFAPEPEGHGAKPEPQPDPEHVLEHHAGATSEHAHEASADIAPATAEHTEASETPAASDESHPVADAWDQDAVETREDHHRG